MSRSRQRGSVLIVVLWVCALLTLLLAAFSYSARVERTVAADVVQQVRARAATDAVLNYLAVVRRVDSAIWEDMQGTLYELPFAEDEVRFRIVPETAFVNINHAPETLLHAVFSGLGVNNPDALARQIIERREGSLDEEAERWYSAHELTLLGAGLENIAGLNEIFTVFGQHADLDYEHASERLRAALDSAGWGVSEAMLDTAVYRVQIEIGAIGRSKKFEATVGFAGGDGGYQIFQVNLYNVSFDLD